MQGFAAAAADPPAPDRGRLLYENHRVTCHSSKVHRRAQPLPIDRQDLRRIVAGWAKEQQLRWSEDEVTDVVDYLVRTHYRTLP